MDIRTWAAVCGMKFDIRGGFDPEKNSGWINVYLTRDGREVSLSLGKLVGSLFGRSGETPKDGYKPRIPSFKEALVDLCNKCKGGQICVPNTDIVFSVPDNLTLEDF